MCWSNEACRCSATNISSATHVDRSQRFDDPAIRNGAAAALSDDAVEFATQGREVSELAIDVCEVLARDGIDCLAGAPFLL